MLFKSLSQGPIRGLGGAAHPGFPPWSGTSPSRRWGTPFQHKNSQLKIKVPIHLRNGVNKHRNRTNRMNSKSRTIRNGSMPAEENNLVHHLAGELLPPIIEIVLNHNALVMLQQPHISIGEAFHILINRRIGLTEGKNRNASNWNGWEEMGKPGEKGRGAIRAWRGARLQDWWRPDRLSLPPPASPWSSVCCCVCELGVAERWSFWRCEWNFYGRSSQPILVAVLQALGCFRRPRVTFGLALTTVAWQRQAVPHIVLAWPLYAACNFVTRSLRIFFH